MSYVFRRIATVYAAVLVLLSLSSCMAARSPSMERETLFRLNYGRFEDEIDLFNLEGNQTGTDTQLYMRDGMFYIVNSGARKVLQFTSFGDLLSVFYNPDFNPHPSFASASDGELNTAATRKAIAHPFNSPSCLAVDNRKRLYVVDRVPGDRQEYDTSVQVVLNSVVLRFAPDGRFMDYLGQEGAGGTPFPPITGVYVTAANQFVVVSRHMNGIIVYWYAEDGQPLYRIPVSFESLPIPGENPEGVFPTLDKVLPDYSGGRLYLKIDYYVSDTDSATGVHAGISFDRSMIYPLDLSSGQYQQPIEIPAYQGVEKDNLGTLTFTKPYELLGITNGGWIFLYTPETGGYALELMDSRSRRMQRRFIEIRTEELVYNTLMLSPDGIISALLATATNASIVWWRTDALIGEIRR